MVRGRKTAAFVATIALVPMLGANDVAKAATIAVTTTADVINAGDGQTSLREAIIEANVGSDTDVINVPAGTYELTLCGSSEDLAATGDLDLRQPVTISGPVSGTATIEQTCDDRVIDVLISPAITLERLTLTGGVANGSLHGGGVAARFSGASVTIRDSVITGNRARDGGAGDGGSGGGVYVDNAGTLVIEGSTISDNHVGSGGDAGGGPAPGWKAGGGGVAFRGFSATPGTVTITDSTISGNSGGVAARGGGGGLWLDTNTLTMTNVDVTGNSVGSDATGRAAGNGGGLAIEPIVGTKIFDVAITGGSISNNTIGAPAGGVGTTNVSGGHGGGLYILGEAGTVDIDGTSFSNNSAGAAKGTFSGGRGGNVYVDLFATSAPAPGTITITDASVAGGEAGSGDTGSGGPAGGAWLSAGKSSVGGAIEVDGTTFSNNTAGDGGGYGGGLVAQSLTSTTAGSIVITDASFDGNDAGDGHDGTFGGEGGQGGGAFLWAQGSDGGVASITIDGAAVTGNSSGAGGDGSSNGGGFAGNGGGLSVTGDTVVVSDSSFAANSSGDGGGGTFGRRGGRGGGLLVFGDELTMTGSSFTGNSTGDGGAGSASFGDGGGDGGGAFLEVDEGIVLAGVTFAANSTGLGSAGQTDGGFGGSGGGLSVEIDGSGGFTASGVEATGNSTGDGASGVTGSGGGGGLGGGIAMRGNGGSLDFEGVVIEGNTTGSGASGGLDNPLDSNVSFGGNGGGLWVIDGEDSATLTILDSSIANNTTGNGGSTTTPDRHGAFGGQGGGLWASVGSHPTTGDGTITLDSTSLTGNDTGRGGAGGPDGPDGGTDPGISPTGGDGGGAHLAAGGDADGTITIVNSTVSDNVTGTRNDGATGQGDGAGLYLHVPTTLVSIDHATIAFNSGRNGVNLLTRADDLEIARSVIGDPNPGDINPGENCNTVSGPITSLGGNVEGLGDSCNFVSGIDIRDFPQPILGELQDNGGNGLTRVPRVSGPNAGGLIDYIADGDCVLGDDQRGVSRPQGDGCDPGAVEANPSINAVDDVIEVDGFTSVIDFISNDIASEGTLDDAAITLPRQPDDGTLLVSQNGTWTYHGGQVSGAFTDFDYRICLGATDDFCDVGTVTLVPKGMSRFVSLPPARLFDTRPPQPGPGPKGFVDGDSSIEVQVTGVAGVPATGVSAVAMNVTATGVAGPGFVTVHASGTDRPDSSNLNVVFAGDTIANLVIVPVGANGRVTMYTKSGTHLLADVAGYFTTGGVSTSTSAPGSKSGRLIPISPTRLFDTRPLQPAPGPKGFVAANSQIDVQVSGRAGVPLAGASAVVMNLTAIASDGPGFVTAFPSGTTRPVASNVNLTGPGQTAPNLVIVPIGANGKVSFYTKSGVHMLADVTGYITDGTASKSLSGLFVPVDPERAFDTRQLQSPPGPKGLVGADTTITTQFSGVAGVPREGVGAVAVNATATGALGPGFVTAWPKGPPRPTASTLNLTYAGQTRPNAAVLPLGTQGRIDFYALTGAHLLTDVFGWYLE